MGGGGYFIIFLKHPKHRKISKKEEKKTSKQTKVVWFFKPCSSFGESETTDCSFVKHSHDMNDLQLYKPDV